MAELKPCPFCGEDPHLYSTEIYCECGAKMVFPLFELGVCGISRYPTWAEAREKAIERWNRRADNAPD